MKRALLAPALALVLAGCDQATPENYARIQEGMSEQEVVEILGRPDASTGHTTLGLSGMSYGWHRNYAYITVTFVNGKMRSKTIGPGRKGWRPSEAGAGKP